MPNLAKFCVPNVLHVFFAVEDKSKQCTQQPFDAFRGQRFGDTSLNILWPVMWKRFWECTVETRTEHHYELQRAPLDATLFHQGGEHGHYLLRCLRDRPEYTHGEEREHVWEVVEKTPPSHSVLSAQA